MSIGTSHRFANMIDGLGRPYRTLAIVRRTPDSYFVQPAGIDGAPVPGTEPREIAATAPLRLYGSHVSAYAARGLHRYFTDNTD